MERISLTLISCVTLLQVVTTVMGTPSGCTEVINQNDVYLRCMQSFNKLFEDVSSLTTGPDKENAMASVLCSAEGRAGVGCVLEYFGKCPQLMSGDDDSGIYDTIEKIQFMGNINTYCDIWKENCVDEFMECTAPLNPKKGGGDMFSKVHTIGGGPSTSTDLDPNYMNVPTFYSNVPKQITILCGPMDAILACGMKLDCPTAMQHIEQKISDNISHQKLVNGKFVMMRVWSDFPEFAESKKYILEECPNLPQDFNSKTLPCIELSVSKAAFVNCWKTNGTEEEEASCTAYNRGKSCVMKHVAPQCGEEDAKILIAASHNFNRLIPEPKRCEQVGGASSLSVSLVAMVTLVATCLNSMFS